MDGRNALDPIDQNILRILSLYENLDLLQLWFELGESHGSVERVTQEEVLDRLDFLFSQGFVERIWEASGTEQLRYRVKSESGAYA